MLAGRFLHITGVVQGVGFRPHVYQLATQHELTGWVRNTSNGVEIRVDGEPEQLQTFVTRLQTELPPLASIDALTISDCPTETFTQFEIQHSEAIAGAVQPISPDIALCDNCRVELLDPNDRRYRYPFINCTNCGPRFTLIQDIPYDRPFTTMSTFDLCDACAEEYRNPLDRRFHAQPVACPDCGPHVWLEINESQIDGNDALYEAIHLLKAGAILAIKGLGGFHLACDATQEATVATLRQRKQRPDKPFALMMRDMAQIEQYCQVSSAEADLLTSTSAPIVLLQRLSHNTTIAPSVAPRQLTLGVMLPYTPLHLLLFDEDMPPLVMTSGNPVDQPIVTDNASARNGLHSFVDGFLMHNRDIHIRTDDSVMRVWRGATLPLRRSRGYVPFPIHLPFELPPILSVGGEMKNTFCVARDTYAFMSHHIGNLSNLTTHESFQNGIKHFESLFRVSPSLIVHDLHPDYLATRYAQSRAKQDGIPRIAVQHHHAHIASCMVENGLRGDQTVIGVCFDGTGYGTDDTIWGGEFLLTDYAQFERVAHFKPMPLPGGDASTRKPARIALAWLITNGLPIDEHLPSIQALSNTERQIVIQQIERGINTPLTSSVGRLFDAVSSLLGVCQVASYEGQAAIELEAMADTNAIGHYPLPETADGIDPAPLLSAVLNDIKAGIPRSVIAGRFHNGIAQRILMTCQHIELLTGIHDVALSGGVFQNVTLLDKTVPLLKSAGFRVYTQQKVPPNDGGLALGQTIIGYMQTKK